MGAHHPGGWRVQLARGAPAELAPAELASADEAETQATETATALHGLYLTGVLGPVVDVGFESGSALGERVYSDDPREVAGYADAVVRVYRAERLFGAVAHFPGLGAADQPTESGPASVGLDLAQLRERDLLPSAPPSTPASRRWCSRTPSIR